MKKLFLCLMVLCVSLLAEAASVPSYKVFKGKVADAAGVPVDYATAAIVDTAGVVTAGSTADENGEYSMAVKPVQSLGHLRLVCSFVGYKEFVAPLEEYVQRSVADTVFLKTVVLENDAEALASAVVSGKRELLEHHFDKIVMNVSELAVAKTGNALDVLKSSPGVTIDKDGNVQLNGQTVSVWIDGRPSNLSGKDLEIYLKGSPGNTIDKVELMSSPSAKFDAEGSGGIINLKTRKGFMQGFSGSVTANGGYLLDYRSVQNENGMSFDGSVNLIYKSDKTYTMLSYSPNYDNMKTLLSESKWYGEDYSSLQRSNTMLHSRSTGHNVKLQNDWNITSSDVFGVIVNFRSSDGKADTDDGSTIGNWLNWNTPQEALFSEMNSATATTEKSRFLYANLNYTHTFDPQRSSSITINADYSRNYSGQDNSQKNVWLHRPSDIGMPDGDGYMDYGFLEDTDRVLDLISLKSDYTTVFWKQTGRIEAGFKGAISLTDNKFASYDNDTSTNPWTLSETPAQVNNFQYREYIAAAYVNVAKQFNSKWNAQVGLRGEMTFTKGLWQDAPHTSEKYFDVFPNATVTWMPSQKYIFSLNYSYRISRPKYWQLNPFVSYINATTYVQGKADLKPAYTHNVSLTAILMGRLSINAGYGRVNNFNDMQVPKFDMTNGKIGLIYDNAGTQDIAFASVTLSEQPITKWWNITFSGSYRYTYFHSYPGLETGLNDNYVNKGSSLFAYAATSFYLPLNFKTGLSGFYCTPQQMGYYKVDSMWNVDFDLSKTFLDGKVSLNFYVKDVFNSLDSNVKIYDGERLSYALDQGFSTTKFLLGVTWRFGKSTNASRRNVGNLDESSRM
ncbi:MAG: outer membrane beta-barrel protein [Candidatus Cryptobacteroides sp.]